MIQASPAQSTRQPLNAGHRAQTKSLYQRLSQSLGACLLALQQRRRRAQLRAELQSLNTRELQDLGIGRGELEYWLNPTTPGQRRR